MLKQDSRAMMLWRQSPMERMCLQQCKTKVASVRDDIVLKHYGTRISLSSE